MMEDVLQSCGWETIHEEELPEREGKYFPYDDLHLAFSTRRYLSQATTDLYNHQKLAIQRYLQGHNVCLTTGTASGKSLPFYVSALECLDRHPDARILSIYPMKALAHEQHQRWVKSLAASGISAQVGAIDGEVPVSQRLTIIRQAKVLIVTPDIVHAWLLSNISDKAVIAFLRSVRLIIVDEGNCSVPGRIERALGKECLECG